MEARPSLGRFYDWWLEEVIEGNLKPLHVSYLVQDKVKSRYVPGRFKPFQSDKGSLPTTLAYCRSAITCQGLLKFGVYIIHIFISLSLPPMPKSLISRLSDIE